MVDNAGVAGRNIPRAIAKGMGDTQRVAQAAALRLANVTVTAIGTGLDNGSGVIIDAGYSVSADLGGGISAGLEDTELETIKKTGRIPASMRRTLEERSQEVEVAAHSLGARLGLSMADGIESGTGVVGTAAAKLVESMVERLRRQLSTLVASGLAQVTTAAVAGGGTLVTNPATGATQAANLPPGAVVQFVGGVPISLSASAIQHGGLAANLPRFHQGGIAPDEMLAILQRGETITPRGAEIVVPVYLDGYRIARATGRYYQDAAHLAGRERR